MISCTGFVVSTKQKNSLKDYSDAVQSLSIRGAERLGDALLRAHNAHVRMLRNSCFPDPSSGYEGGKSMLLIIRKF